MGGSIGQGVVIPGDTFPLLSSFMTKLFNPPNPLNLGTLKGAYFFGGISKGGPLVNYADSTNPLTQIGSPTIFSNYAECDYLNCFDTGIAFDTNPTAIFAIVKPPAIGATSATKGLAYGDWQSGVSNQGNTLEVTQNTDNVTGDFYLTSATGGKVTAEYAVTDQADFQIFCNYWVSGSYAAGGIYDPVTNTLQSNNVVNGVFTPSGRTIRIGGHYDTSQFRGKSEVAAVLIYTGIPDVASIVSWLYQVQGPQVQLWSGS